MSVCLSLSNSARNAMSSASTSTTSRIEALRRGRDATLEVAEEELLAAAGLRFTNALPDLADCNVYIVTVPTPIDDHKRPDLASADQRLAHGRHGAQARRHRHLRVDRLSRSDGRGLRADPGAGFRPDVQRGLFRRLQPGAHQPRRQASSGGDHQEGHLGIDAGNRGFRRRALSPRSSLPARTRRRASRWRRPRKSSKTPSATSTSRW